jgi:hypothetical protein
MRILKKSGLMAMLLGLTVLLSVIPAQPAFGWGAVDYVSEVHQAILNTAYDFLRSDHVLDYTIFPSIDDILDNEGVTNPILKTGPGPDGAESNSPWSEHWYNASSPGENKGQSPESVAREFGVLTRAIINGQTTAESSGESPAHAAAWGAHFLADVETPFHTNGTSLEQIEEIFAQQGGHNANVITLGRDIVGSLDFCYSCALKPDWDFKDEIESFLITNVQDPNADWFDPWYFNGATGVTSSHVLWEGAAGSITKIPAVTSYSRDWKNPTPSFTGFVENQAKQAAAFTKLAAENARITQLDGLNDPVDCVARAAQRVATLWRASVSACIGEITVTVPDKKHPEKLKVTAIFKNKGNGNCGSTQAKLSLTGGTVLDSATKNVTDFSARTSSKPVSWNIEVTKLSGAMLNIETIYSYSQPDLQYSSTKYHTGKIEPAETTTTTETTTEPKTTSVVILVNASKQMGKITHAEYVPMVLKAMQALPDSVIEVALYAYGEDPQMGDCSVWGHPFMTRQEVVDYANSLLNVKAESRGSAPLAKAITTCGDVLNSQGKGNTKVIILISNSAKDTCGGDPRKAANDLAGVKVKKSTSWFVEPAYAADGDTTVSLQVIGVYVDSTLEEQGLKDLATAGNGQYFPVENVNQMTGALEKAIKASESSTGSFFDKVQPWWFIVAGIVLLLIILLSVRGKRRVQPVVQTAGVSLRPVKGPVVPPAASVYTPERKMLYCPRCGSPTNQGAAFCVHCGATMAFSAPAAAVTGAALQAGIFCGNCGTTNGAGSAFCKKCGSSLALAAPAAAMTGAAPQAGIFCNYCGTTNAAGSAFCKQCGSSLALSVPAAMTRAAPQASIFCNYCGTTNAAGSAFCKQCGSPLALAAPAAATNGAAPQAGIFCNYCGTTNAAGSMFCNRCGAAIRSGVQQVQTAPAIAAPKKNYWAYWLLPVFFALIGGLIAWASLRKDNPSLANRILIFSLFITLLIFFGIVQNML